MSDVIDEHRLYLSDQSRIAAYESALKNVINKNDTVIDLGAGTGIWGLIACRHGAKKIYSIEQTSLANLTKKVAMDNDFGDRVILINDHSKNIELPELADVVCCDQIGRFGFEAGIFSYFADAANRLAKQDARFVPNFIEFFAAPAHIKERAQNVSFWNQPIHRFDFSALSTIATNSGYPVKLQPSDLIGGSGMLARRKTTCADAFSGKTSLVIEKNSMMSGLGCWFKAELADNIYVSNSPLDPNRIGRKNVFLPIDRTVEVLKGDHIDVFMHFIPNETLLSWIVHIKREGRVVFQSSHSTFCGMFVSEKDMKKAHPDFSPQLTTRGLAQKSVLELCDGEVSLVNIEKKLQELYPNLFQTQSEASCFVAEVVTRYAE